MEAERQRIEAMPESKEKTAAGLTLEIRKTIHETLPQVSGRVKCAAEILAEIGNAYNDTVSEFIRNIIEIPRIVIQPSDEVDSRFRDFDLDAGKLNYPPVSEEILIRFLARKENTDQILIGKYGIAADKPENLILNELVSLPEVDYDTQTELLHKLVGQAIAKLKSYLTEDEFVNVVKFHKKEIAAFIYAQMKPHFYCTTKSYEEPIVKPFTEIEGHNLTKIKADSIHHYNDTITPTGAIPQKVFSGFKRACHSMCQFDAKGEKDFAAMLEGDKDVVKWLRPAPKQFKTYWDRRGSRTYEPDFVVETADAIYLTEIKAENQLEQEEVRERQGRLCSTANTPRNIPGKTGGKPWRYLLIPHTEVLPNMSLAYFAAKREFVE
jgi:type III restriction enzyme